MSTYTFPTSTSPTSETSRQRDHSIAHSRNLSTVSSATLLANTSLPYEPLLPPTTQTSTGACDVILHQSRFSPTISTPRWSQKNLKPSSSRDEKSKHSGSIHHRQSKRVWFKIGLETVMVAWSLYTMIRYLYAFTIYESMHGQVATLGLGICAGLSFAFTCCSIILSAVNKRLLLRGVYVKSLSHVHSILQYPTSLCFLFPAITNLVLLFVWKHTSTVDLNLHHRCKIDVDLLWTTSRSSCNNLGQPWGAWIILAVLRIFLSCIIIIAFHIVQSSQVISMPKLSYLKPSKSQRSLSPRPSSKKFASIPPLTHDDRSIYHQGTEYNSSNQSSWRHRLRSGYSSSSGTSEAAPSYSNSDFLPIPNSPQNATFLERFRRRISIITQETDDAIAYARASVASTSCNSEDSVESQTLNETCQASDKEPHSPHSPQWGHIATYDDQEDDFYGSPSAEGHSDSNYYPADEQIRMMNGYIKRMPTIQSMGSRELVGSIGSGNTNHERNGPRPSTRNTMLSWNGTDMSGSDPRRKSLTAQAGLLYGIPDVSEVGELVKQEMSIKMVGSFESSKGQDDNQEPLPDYYSSMESKASVQSFYTAHSEVDRIDKSKVSVAEDAHVPVS